MMNFEIQNLIVINFNFVNATAVELPAGPRWRGSVTRANISIHIANNKVTYE